jgi:hypothetical protein
LKKDSALSCERNNIFHETLSSTKAVLRLYFGTYNNIIIKGTILEYNSFMLANALLKRRSCYISNI